MASDKLSNYVFSQTGLKRRNIPGDEVRFIS